jgi:activator of HSP90 ATPase
LKKVLFEEDLNDPTFTKITLIHTNLPKGTASSYKDGWKEYYFEPMKKYFK